MAMRKITFPVVLFIIVCSVAVFICYVLSTYDTEESYNKDTNKGSALDITRSNLFEIVQNYTMTTDLQTLNNDINVTNNTTYLVYDCSKRYEGACGGWSDRLSGMLSLYVISILTEKRFLIHHDKPCPLSNYLMPNDYNWQYDETMLTGRSKLYRNYFCKVPSPIKSHSISELQRTFSEDVNFVRMNWDYTKHFQKIKHISKVVPWITKLHISEMYAQFFNFLFKPKHTIRNDVEQILNQTKRKLACAHIRIGGSSTIPGDDHRLDPSQLREIWDFLMDMKKQNYSIFVATDAEIVRSKAETMFKESLIVIPGPITHVELTKRGKICDGFRKSFIEFFLLTRCRELVLTCSGFGMTAAYLNQVYDHMYCFKNALFACSRYTIHDFYPGEMLSPY